ncbi:MAG TPA: hypothetical protein VGK15_05050 [Candidatus Limnocylindria bacterium]|jgi:hypothetical protein
MDTHVTTEEAEMTEIEERIEAQKEHARLLRSQLDCECPDKSCPVAHES